MAQDKKSFVAYTDWNEIFKKLTDEEAGKLSKIIFAFVADENPIAPDRITELLFEPIKQHLKRDLKKYDEIKKRRSEAGRNGGLKSGEIRSKTIQKEANEANALKTQANEAVNDNVNVNDNVIKKKVDIVARKLKFSSTLQPFLEIYGKEFLNDFYKYWTEPNISNSKFKKELEKTWDLERRLGTWAKNDKNFNKSENGNKQSFANNTAKKQFVYNRDDALKALAGKT